MSRCKSRTLGKTNLENETYYNSSSHSLDKANGKQDKVAIAIFQHTAKLHRYVGWKTPRSFKMTPRIHSKGSQELGMFLCL